MLDLATTFERSDARLACQLRREVLRPSSS
jgi:hypothetical protein